MRRSSRSLVVVAAVVAALGAGCGNGIRITGTLGDRPLEAAGTAAAWVDATEFVDGGDGSFALANRPTDATVLHLAFFEAVFDPAADVSQMTVGERAARADAIAAGDRLDVTVQRGEAVRPGDALATLNDGELPPQVLPFIVGIDVALVDNGGVDYPDAIARAGSTRTATLDVSEVTPVFQGVLDIDVAAADGEAGAAEGNVVVEFAATLLPERLAECNFARDAQGAIDPCTLTAR
jgi:hypothetical protein